MAMIVLLSGCLGLALGLRFKVLVLLPAATAVLAAAACVGMMRGSGVSATAIVVAASETSLQIGYLLGVGILVAVAGRRVHRSVTRGRPTQAVSGGAG
jgi:hypothetical protein